MHLCYVDELVSRALSIEPSERPTVDCDLLLGVDREARVKGLSASDSSRYQLHRDAKKETAPIEGGRGCRAGRAISSPPWGTRHYDNKAWDQKAQALRLAGVGGTE